MISKQKSKFIFGMHPLKKNVKKDGNPGRVLYIRLLVYLNILDFCIALILVLLFTYSF